MTDADQQVVADLGPQEVQVVLALHLVADDLQGDPSQREYWGDQMRNGLVQAFDRAYKGNRAPLIIGNHFESWNVGTYMRAIEETIATVCVKRDVKCVSFRQLADWLDAQDPQVLAKMRTLEVGQAPKGGWAAFLAAQPAAPAASPAVRRAGQH